VWKVARCSSAAPLLFEEFEDHVDGGVLANNPCQVRSQAFLSVPWSSSICSVSYVHTKLVFTVHIELFVVCHCLVLFEHLATILASMDSQ
jgi:patatin-like phospholipase/acyl hydrolase